MRDPIEFYDADASDDDYVMMLQGHLKDWSDSMRRMREALRLAKVDITAAIDFVEFQAQAPAQGARQTIERIDAALGEVC
jgi:hypothetical protein